MILLNAFLYTTPVWLITFTLFANVFLFYLLGSKTGRYIKSKRPESKADGIGPLEGALLGLLSLLLGFTLSQSASRYDTRRALIIHEANDIGTAILRSDMYQDSIKIQFKNDLKEYVETRIAYYETIDEGEISKSLSEAEKISDRIWDRVVISSKKNPDFVRDNQMIPAVNSMIDIVNNRDAGRLARVPDPIIYLLMILTVLGSFIIGYAKKENKIDWIILTLYSVMTIATIFVILDIDRPRRGFIQTSVPHEKINQLRNLFHAE